MSLNLGTMFAAVALDSSNFRNGLSALPGISWRCHKCEESSVGSCFRRKQNGWVRMMGTEKQTADLISNPPYKSGKL